MTIGIWILGDQLWPYQAALQSVGAKKVPVIFIEAIAHIRQRPYHRQKLVLVWSAMRHFAQTLAQQGWPVTYCEVETFQEALQDWIGQYNLQELRVMEPNDRPFLQLLQSLTLDCPITLIENNQFLWSTREFADWAQGRKRLLMEDFYRLSRKRFQILMAGEAPIGGTWNFDRENRNRPPSGLQGPAIPAIAPDSLTQHVIDKVSRLDLPLYGELLPFCWAVDRLQAQQLLADFIDHRLETFGPYEDAMVTGQDTLWHSVLSPYLNLGLLHPRELVQAAEQAYGQRQLPLNSVEGFIRQVIGWREYMRGLYSFLGADYPQHNWFGHDRPLPAFYWTGDTSMNCLRQVLQQVRRTGYAHHIQRLMVLSNFALIAGVAPQAIEDWFHAAFIDGYDWVMQTNVLGMGQFADGGILASKPYASAANYINRMSNYCAGCVYDPKQRTGPKACPFNFFYWDFLSRHQEKLYAQGRMTLILSNLKKLPLAERERLQQEGNHWWQENS